MSESSKDLFAHRAHDYDERPVPQQISEGVWAALQRGVALSADWEVMDFGAGTGLICAKVAPHVRRILAVDVSRAMLDRLTEKPELAGKAEVFCHNLLEAPLGRTVDLVVSAMAMHHVEDTPALLRALWEHLKPHGKVALADLDTEPGDFHPPGMEGIFHHGFDRDALGALMEEAGFVDTQFSTACTVSRNERAYSIFLMTATRPADSP